LESAVTELFHKSTVNFFIAYRQLGTLSCTSQYSVNKLYSG